MRALSTASIVLGSLLLHAACTSAPPTPTNHVSGGGSDGGLAIDGDRTDITDIQNPALIDPVEGPGGTLVTVSGSGFRIGDTVEISGKNLTTTALVTVTLVGGAIVALMPEEGVDAPMAVEVRVRRGADVAPRTPLAFTLKPGRNYYLAPGGDDGAAGTLAAPWRTITAAARKMSPGDVATLRGGTYSGQVQIDASGTAAAPLTFTAYPSETPLLVEPSTQPGADLDTVRVTGAYVVLDHLRLTDQNDPGQAIWIAGSAHHVTISNCEIFGSRGQGILITGNQNQIYHNRIHGNGSHTPYDHGIYVEGGGNLIRANTIHDNWTFGIQLYHGAGGDAAGNTVENNYVYHNGYGSTGEDASAPNAGIVIAANHPNSIIRNNRFCANSQYGIYLIDGQNGTQMSGNVTCYNGRGGMFLRYPGSGSAVTGSISYNDSGFAFSSAPGVTSDGNVFYRALGTPTLVWDGQPCDLAGFRGASSQDGKSQVVDPKLARLPSDGFDPAAATSYDFCTPLNPELCKPLS